MSNGEPIASVRGPGHRLWAVRPFLAPVVALGFGDARGFRLALERGSPVEGGRAPHRLVTLPRDAIRLRIRPARHGGVLGGLLGPLLAGRFLSPERAPRELALWLALDQRGIPLPTPVAAIASRSAGLWSCHFATVERDHARDGLAWLAADPAPGTLRRGALAFARALRRLHDAGVVHGDLHLRNLLFESKQGPADDGEMLCLFVDLDHAKVYGATGSSVPPWARLAELARLARSIEKHGLADRIDVRLRARVVAAYCGGDRALRQALLASRERERWRLARHRIAWRATRALRPTGLGA